MNKKILAILIIIVLIILIVFVEFRKTKQQELTSDTTPSTNSDLVAPTSETSPINLNDQNNDIESRISAGATGNEVPPGNTNGAQ